MSTLPENDRCRQATDRQLYKTGGRSSINHIRAVNASPGLTELVAVGGVLIIALVALARRRVSSPAERMKIRAAAWSLLSETPADANDSRARAQENESAERNA